MLSQLMLSVFILSIFTVNYCDCTDPVREAANKRNVWPGGTVPCIIDYRFSERERTLIFHAIQILESRTCIKFVQHTNEYDHVYIIRGFGCSSYVGRRGGRQPVSMGFSCMYAGTIMHELLHVLGLFHEQSREDRDNYLDIYIENAIPGTEINFEKFTFEETGDLGEPYDLGSLMHYNNYEFSQNGKMTVIAKNGFILRHTKLKTSPTDIDVRRLYKCISDSKPTVIQPDDCQDISPHCEGWAQFGLCDKNEQYMSLACQRSCNKCVSGRVRSCQDHDDTCLSWAAIGQCKTAAGSMRILCPHACRFCQT